MYCFFTSPWFSHHTNDCSVSPAIQEPPAPSTRSFLFILFWLALLRNIYAKLVPRRNQNKPSGRVYRRYIILATVNTTKCNNIIYSSKRVAGLRF